MESESMLLQMRNISLSFPGVKALDDVDFDLRKGEIVSLLGENGAGKSTLMKILTGVHTHHTGQIHFDGEPLILHNTQDAFTRGISIVFQEFNLCPNLSVMENLFLGHEKRGPLGFISYKTMRKEAKALFRRLRVEVPVEALVKDLGVAQQQMIEIAKALSFETRILIMDEPTSALAQEEIDNLFEILHDLRKQGISIVFISHKLKEVLSISDRIVCLRDGCNSGVIENVAEATEDDLVHMMVGRVIDKLYSSRKSQAENEYILEVKNLTGPPNIKNITFSLKKGEILGVAGLVGAGRTEMTRLLTGAEKSTGGEIFLEGKKVVISHPADSVKLGIACVPEDRKHHGLVLPMSVRENTTMSIHGKLSNRLGILDLKREKVHTDERIKALQIKVSDREQTARNLSGGNQQKVVIGKWLSIEPRILILDEPTRGIDVGAKAEVHRIISELADNGVSIIVISSELPEVLHLADRILVMREGETVTDFVRDIATEEDIMKAAVSHA